MDLLRRESGAAFDERVVDALARVIAGGSEREPVPALVAAHAV